MSESIANNLSRPPGSRLPSLDGWRAVSIALVLGEHSDRTAGFPGKLEDPFRWLFDGDLGVRFFFVISGFLITYLLLGEHQKSGRINLTKFYARRALRILPVYWAFLVVVAILEFTTPWSQKPVTWLGNLTFTTNFLPGSWPTSHLWSLAVEEQFYFLWPFLLSFVVAAGPKRIYALLALPLVSAPLFRILAYRHLLPHALAPYFEPHSFFVRDDSLAIGCLVATFYVYNEQLVSNWLKARPLANVLLALVLVSVPYVLTHLLKGGMFTVPLGWTFEAAGLALLMAQSVVSPSLFSFLNWGWVCWLGVLSYSIYVWQQLFCADQGDFGFANHWLTSFPGWILGALVVAVVSHYCLEKPLMNLRSKLRVTKTA